MRERETFLSGSRTTTVSVAAADTATAWRWSRSSRGVRRSTAPPSGRRERTATSRTRSGSTGRRADRGNLLEINHLRGAARGPGGCASVATVAEEREPGGRISGGRSPGGWSSGGRSPGAQSPGARSPGARSPGARSPGAQSPSGRSPGARLPGGRSSDGWSSGVRGLNRGDGGSTPAHAAVSAARGASRRVCPEASWSTKSPTACRVIRHFPWWSCMWWNLQSRMPRSMSVRPRSATHSSMWWASQ